ncbi:MAG TPA: hypothetical protein VE621_02380, partial [Bryobacteraceae bacterium]|nr:hypothetical protein [Bryobacteraceae bacterium]
MRLLCVFLVLSCALAGAAERRLITETDLYRFQWIGGPQMSPDGSSVAFAKVKVNEKHTDYESSLYLVSTSGGEPRRLTNGTRDSSPTWSPDGKMLAFLRAIEKDGKPQPPQIYLLPMNGGEARALTELPKGASNPVWSPDGKRITFLSGTLPKDQEKKKEGEEPSDVVVVLTARYRSNGSGYVDRSRPSHIWVIDVAADAKPKQLTTGSFAETDPAWSADGSAIYFLSDRKLEPEYDSPDADVWSVPSNGGEIKRVVSIDGPITSLSLNPSGRQVAFIGFVNKPVRSYSQSDLFVADLGSGSVRNLTEKFDEDISGRVGGDNGTPRGGSREAPFWSRDGRYLFATRGKEGRENFVRVDTETSKVEVLVPGDHAVQAWTADDKASKVALLISTPTQIHDLWTVDIGKSGLKRLTDVNKHLWSELKLTEPEMIWYPSFDGKKVQAWVQRPPDFDPNKKYPMILNIHGGPHSAYGYVFDHEFQWMAAKGYVVLYPNPR